MPQYCWASLDWRVMAWLRVPRAGHWLDRGRGPGRGVPDRARNDSGPYFRGVLLLPFQVSVLGTPSPSVTPTNLLYNVIATPGAVPVLAAGTDRRAAGPGAHRRDAARRRRRIVHPGQADPRPPRLRPVVAAVLIPLGIWLVLTRPARAGVPDRPARPIRVPVLMVLAAVVGCVGGISDRWRRVPGTGPDRVGPQAVRGAAPAALAATFATLGRGVITFTLWRSSSTSRWLRTGRPVSPWASGPGRRLHRCPSPVTDAAMCDPPPGRRLGHRHRGLFPVIRPGLTTALRLSAL